MGEVLKTWFSTRLGLIINLSPEHFGMYVSDGTLLARLLHSYDIINSQILETITPSEHPAIRLNNLKCLNIWLKLINVVCDDEMLQEISEGKGSTAIRLFYQVFLRLENKDRLSFIAKQAGKEAQCLSRSRFQVEIVPENVTQDEEPEDYNPLSVPLIKSREIIDWYKTLQKSLTDKCEAVKEKFAEIFQSMPNLSETCEESAQTKMEAKETSEDQQELDKLIGQHDDDDDSSLDYFELMDLSKKYQSFRRDSVTNTEQAAQYISQLQERSRKDAATQSFKSRIKKMLLNELWDKMMKMQNQQFDETVSEKLLKQSQYEKQITTKLLGIQNEQKVMMENRHLIEKLLSDKRKQEFQAALTRDISSMDRKLHIQETEQARKLELHKRLYSEKIAFKQKLVSDMCFDIVEALVDIAVEAAVYKSTAPNNVIPKMVWDQWKVLFLNCAPIFQLTDVQDIISLAIEDDIEPIVRLELDRQNVLNEHDFDEYLNLTGPWLLDDLCPELLPSPAQSILGYVVHRLLGLKYPCVPPPPLANLPSISVAALLIGVSDERVISLLNNLLRKESIRLVSLDTATNFCLEAYQNEAPQIDKTNQTSEPKEDAEQEKMFSTTNVTLPSTGSTHKEIDVLQENNETLLQNNNISHSQATVTATDENDQTEPQETVEFTEKQTQTPRNIPDDDEPENGLSKKAELGKQAFEEVSAGMQLSDELLVSMLVEYLREQEDIKGFVVLNYPLTHAQAAALEKAFTGKELPKVEEELDTMEYMQGIEIKQPPLTESTAQDQQAAEEQLQESPKLHESRLVPKTCIPPNNAPFETYFTAYITVKKENPLPLESEEEDFDIWDESLLTPLQRLYVDQGTNYSFFYENFDLQTVKQLARIIIGDTSIPPKPSTELFGKIVDELEIRSPPTTTNKRVTISKKRMKSKPPETEQEEDQVVTTDEDTAEKVLDKKGKKSIKSKSKGGKTSEDKIAVETKGKHAKRTKSKGGKTSEDKIPVETKRKQSKKLSIQKQEVANEVTDKRRKGKKDDLPVVPPGDEGWSYAELEQPATMQIALATFWENIENVYIKEFIKLLFMKRIQNSNILPYTHFVEETMKSFIQRPDEKQDIVRDFQTQYNEASYKEDVEMKLELHCRVAELRSLLLEICDRRKEDSEIERQRIIADNWVAEEMCLLTNIFIDAIQLESDRCVDTLQLLHDYYITMLKKMPETQLEKLQLNRLSMLENGDTKDETENKSKRPKDSFSDDLSFKGTIAKLLINVEQTGQNQITPFQTTLAESVKVVSSQVEHFNTAYQDIIANEDVSKESPKKKKKGNLTGSENFEELSKIREGSKDLCLEWLCAVRSETARTLFRVELLKARGVADLNEIQELMKSVFHPIFDEIATKYINEVEAVENLCQTLGSAIEEGLSVQNELRLQSELFTAKESSLMFDDLPKPPPPPVREIDNEYEFQIRQLQILMETFVRVAPQGFMPTIAFTYILQDLAILETDNTNPKVFPKVWTELTSLEIGNVIKELTASSEYIYWKDFIIYGLNFHPPSQDELLKCRKQFLSFDHDVCEIISHEDYSKIQFWFEASEPVTPELSLRICLAKELLFTLFQVREYFTNYSALLFNLCKDEDPGIGIAKAFALCLGNEVYTTEIMELEKREEIENIIKEIEKQNQVAEEEATQLVDIIIENTIQRTEGLTIEEVYELAEGSGTGIIDFNYYSMVKKQNADSALPMHQVDTEEPAEEVVENTPTVQSTSETQSVTLLLAENTSSQSTEIFFFEISFELVLTVLTIGFPWYTNSANLFEGKTLQESLEQVFQEIADPSTNTVLPRELLQHPFMERLLSSSNRFQNLTLHEIVAGTLSNRQVDIMPTKVDSYSNRLKA